MARTAVVAGTATAVSNRVSRRQAQRWAAQDEGDYPQQYAEPEPAAASGDVGQSRVDELKELAALKDQGVLSEQEFASEKARVLAG
jgi:Short C-terminal domain